MEDNNNDCNTGVVVNGLRCLRCGHSWIPRKAGRVPVTCPSPACHSPYWNVPRIRSKETKDNE